MIFDCVYTTVINTMLAILTEFFLELLSCILGCYSRHRSTSFLCFCARRTSTLSHLLPRGESCLGVIEQVYNFVEHRGVLVAHFLFLMLIETKHSYRFWIQIQSDGMRGLDSSPVWKKCHTLILRKPLMLKRCADSWTQVLSERVTEPAHGPWASPIVLVAKKGESTHFCLTFANWIVSPGRMPIVMPILTIHLMP